MKRTKEHVPLMQIEVWKMKDKVYRETKNMNGREFFAYIKDKGGRSSHKGREALSAKS